MKTFILLVSLLITVPAFALDVSSVTFKIASSAATSTFNLRIGKMTGGELAKEKSGNEKIQAIAISAFTDYFLTKSQAIDTSSLSAILIQADQDTKMYIGSDLTNYIIVYGGIDMNFVLK